MDDTHQPVPEPPDEFAVPSEEAGGDIETRLADLARADAADAPALAERLAADLSQELESDRAARPDGAVGGAFH